SHYALIPKRFAASWLDSVNIGSHELIFPGPGFLHRGKPRIVKFGVGGFLPALVSVGVLLRPNPELLALRTGRKWFSVESKSRDPGGGRKGFREALLQRQVNLFVVLGVKVGQVAEPVRELDGAVGSETVEEGLAECLVVGIVAESAVEFGEFGRRDLSTAREPGGDVLGLLGLVLLDVALGLAVEAVERAVLEVGVDDDGLEGDLDALVGVGGVFDELVYAVLPGTDALADVFLVVRIVVVGGAGAFAEPLGVEGDVALVGHFHAGVDGFLAGGSEFAAQVGELGVRVTQK